MSPTVIIDAESEPGAWAAAIADTPGLAARAVDYQHPSDHQSVRLEREVHGAAVHSDGGTPR